ncbi:4Fe-4S binding protein, partial [Candidatus Bathyarchaeota archaeon]|nr:4Fe-4S binding protein [Candidatus Bathyarchaeota archaeon]
MPSGEIVKSSRHRIPYSVLRNFIELAGFLLLNALIFKYVYPFIDVEASAVPIPVLMSLKSSTSLAAGALDYVQVMFSRPIFPLLPFAVVLIAGSVVGRLLCGWLCPIGFIQDLILKMRGNGSKVNPRTHAALVRLKYLLLSVTLFFSVTLALSLQAGESKYKEALGPFAKGLFLPIQPETALFANLPRLIQSGAESGLLDFSGPTAPGFLVLAGFALSLLLLAGAYMVPWFWCRYLCPTGALMSIFMRFSFMGMKRDPSKCTKCGECVEACPMQVRILDLPWEKFNDPE